MPRRRGHGEGSIFQRADGQWCAELDLGRDGDGKRRRRTIYGRTRKEVAGKLQALLGELQTTGTVVDHSKITLGEYMDSWLVQAATRLKPATAESYRQYARAHIVPTLGGIPISKLQPIQLQQLYTSLLSAGKAKRTVQYVHAILRRALNQAVKMGMILRNPATLVEAPRPDRQEMRVLTPSEAQKLIESLRGDPLMALYYMALATGCRRGELIALRWSDVTWARPAITVNRTAEFVDKKVIWTEPKTTRSRRTIPLPANAVSVLKAHRTRQLQERLLAGEMFADQDLVFSRYDGSPVNPGHVTQHFALVVKKAGLPQVRLHDLRHTHATMLLAAGVHPKIVSERLGHSSVVMTLDTYSHVLPTMQEEVARKLDAIMPSIKAQ